METNSPTQDTHQTVLAALEASRDVRVEGERRAEGWTRRVDDLEMVERLHASLVERDELIAAQQDTIAALRIEIHLLRRRYGLTPEVAQELLGLVGV